MEISYAKNIRKFICILTVGGLSFLSLSAAAADQYPGGSWRSTCNNWKSWQRHDGRQFIQVIEADCLTGQVDRGGWSGWRKHSRVERPAVLYWAFGNHVRGVKSCWTMRNEWGTLRCD